MKQKNWTANILATTFGIGFGLIIALIAFRLFIGDYRLLLTYLYDDAVVFRSGNGDIVFWQSEYVQPLDNPDEILSVHRIQTDDIGFRLPENPAPSYQAIALGDSFTEANNVARPWSDVFAAQSNLNTRNLGFRGYGMRQYTTIWEQFGQQENPDVVIIGFFGANDVFAAGSDLDPFELPRDERERALNADIVSNYTDLGEESRIYPKYLTDNIPITFLTTYVSWMNIEANQFTGSVNYQVISENLQQIYDSLDDDTCPVFAYFPSKPEVYFPYMDDADYPDLLHGIHTPLINSDGALHLVEDFNIDLERTMTWRTNTGDMMTDLAASIGYESINLLPVFEARAAQNEMLYYTYDTHWNQAGHNLTGETIAEFVSNQCAG